MSLTRVVVDWPGRLRSMFHSRVPWAAFLIRKDCSMSVVVLEDRCVFPLDWLPMDWAVGVLSLMLLGRAGEAGCLSNFEGKPSFSVWWFFWKKQML